MEVDRIRAHNVPFFYALLSLQRLWVQIYRTIPPARRCLSFAHLVILVGSVQRYPFVPNPGQAARSARVEAVVSLWQTPDKLQGL